MRGVKHVSVSALHKLMREPDSTWMAPTCTQPIQARVQVPGSKSETARALFLAAVAGEPTLILGALESRDTQLMRDALTTLGATFDTTADGLQVTPINLANALNEASPAALVSERTIDVGLAGTVMRFLPPLAALLPGVTHFVGDSEASARPLAPTLDLVRQLGATVICHEAPDCLPFTVVSSAKNHGLPRELCVDGSLSSQFVSAALLIAAVLVSLDGEERSVHAAGNLISMPHIDMTCQAVRDRGVNVTLSPSSPAAASWLLQGNAQDATPIKGGRRAIAPDLTNAGVFLAAAMLCTGSVLIPDWPHNTTQAGDAWRHFFTTLGAQVELSDQGLAMSVKDVSFPGVDMDFSAIGELTPTAVAVLLFASSPSHIRGVEHIRGHETDRLAALATEIRRLGGHVVEHPDGLEFLPLPHGVSPNSPLHSYADHRMATFAALVGLRVPGVQVDDIAATSKTLPDFPRLWSALTATHHPSPSDSSQEARYGTA